MWSMVSFLLESLVFILVGLDLPYAFRAISGHSFGMLVWYGTAVSVVMILVRLIWVFPSAYIPRLITRRRGIDGTRERPLPPWRWVAFVGWSGMRGGDSLVIALALPLTTGSGSPFPARDLIVFVTFAVIFVTLVLQGLSLGPVIRALGLAGDTRDEAEEAHARRVSAEAGLERLAALGERDGANPEVVRYLRRRRSQRARRWAARDRKRHGARDPEHRALESEAGAAEQASASYRQLRRAMIDAEREAVIDLRDRGVISDEVMRRVQRDLDLEQMLLEGARDGAPASPYEIQ
jgi:CPA1 family monovalent cation:H+ antiporter